MLLPQQIKEIYTMAAIYPDGKDGINDEDIQILARKIGAIKDDVYDSNFDAALAIECILRVIGSGTPSANRVQGLQNLYKHLAKSYRIQIYQAVGPPGSPGSPGPQGAYTLDIYKVVAVGSRNDAPTGGMIDPVNGIVVPPAGWLSAPATAGAGQELIGSRALVNPSIHTAIYIPVWSAPFIIGEAVDLGPYRKSVDQDKIDKALSDRITTNADAIAAFPRTYRTISDQKLIDDAQDTKIAENKAAIDALVIPDPVDLSDYRTADDQDTIDEAQDAKIKKNADDIDALDIPDIEANPEGEASSALTKLEVDGTVYGIPEGTAVEANPAGAATAVLSKLDVDGTVYSLPQGGGTGSGVSVDIFNAAITAQNTARANLQSRSDSGDDFTFSIVVSADALTTDLSNSAARNYPLMLWVQPSNGAASFVHSGTTYNRGDLLLIAPRSNSIERGPRIADATTLAALINTVNGINRNVTENKTAIANLADKVGPLGGSIGITPSSIPNAAAVMGDYVVAFEDLDVAWLTAKGANQLDIWFNNVGVHAVRPYSPAADARIAVNVNENEARAIGIGGAKIIRVGGVFRNSGTFVAIINGFLEVGGALTEVYKRITDERVRSNNGDVLVVQEIGTSAAMQTLLDRPDVDQGANEWIEITGDFNLRIANADFVFKTKEIWQLAPNGQIPTKLLDPPPEPVTPFEPSLNQQIAWLSAHTEPSVITYTGDGDVAALTGTIVLVVPNPELVTSQVWAEGTINGQPSLARFEWASTNTRLNYPINAALARRLADADLDELDIRLTFYDAANAGNIVEELSYGTALIGFPTATGGGLDAVSSDATLTGKGTAGDPLKVANPFKGNEFTNTYKAILDRPLKQTITPAANATEIDADNGLVVDLNMNRATVTIQLTEGNDGEVMQVRAIQDATGGRLIAFHSSVGGRAAPTLSTGANDEDLMYFQRKGTTWEFVSIDKDA